MPFAALAANYVAPGSGVKQTLTLDHSLHVVTMDAECDIVFDAAADFIASHSTKITD